MTGGLIAAQEQRLTRIAELHRIERRRPLTVDEAMVRWNLKRLVRLDARLWT